MDKENDFDEKQVYEFYESIKISGDRLNRTLKNIILYQNIKNNLIELDKNSSAEVLESLSNVKTKLRPIYDNLKRRIRFTINQANIRIEKTYLDFILFELIDNALKFSPKSKIIDVTGNHYNKEFYELEIRDYGIGFSEEELKKIDAAKQFNREKRDQQGLGLGLFLSKTIIKKANGVFSIISNGKEGTSIKIFLPLHPYAIKD